jgi:hypothetical protein
MRLTDRFRRLDDRVLGPAPPGRRRDPFSPASLGWAAVGFIGSLVTRTTWGLVLFISIGVVGMFTAGLLKSRRSIAAATPTDAQVTADKHDVVRDWLTRRNLRVRQMLVFAARFPFVAAPLIGAAAGFGISNQRSCATYRGSDKCSFYIPGHHTVPGGVAWGFLVGLLVYGGAVLIRQSLIRAAEARSAADAEMAHRESGCGRSPEGEHDEPTEPEFVLVRPDRRREPS